MIRAETMAVTLKTITESRTTTPVSKGQVSISCTSLWIFSTAVSSWTSASLTGPVAAASNRWRTRVYRGPDPAQQLPLRLPQFASQRQEGQEERAREGSQGTRVDACRSVVSRAARAGRAFPACTKTPTANLPIQDLSSTSTSSIGPSPRFSGLCLTAGNHTASPASHDMSSEVPSS